MGHGSPCFPVFNNYVTAAIIEADKSHDDTIALTHQILEYFNQAKKEYPRWSLQGVSSPHLGSELAEARILPTNFFASTAVALGTLRAGTVQWS
jgi:hypothetical protein